MTVHGSALPVLPRARSTQDDTGTRTVPRVGLTVPDRASRTPRSQRHQERAAKLSAALFLLILSWPVRLVPPTWSIVFFSAIAFVTLVAFCRTRLAIPIALAAFFGVSLAEVAFHAFVDGVGPYFISQSNHLLQFPIYYTAILLLLQNFDWQKLLSSSHVILYMLILVLVYSTIDRMLPDYEGYNEVDITLFSVLIGLFLRKREGKLSGYLLYPIIVVVSFLSDRFSVPIVLALFVIFSFVRPNIRIVIVVAIFVILAPLFIYTNLSTSQLQWIYQIDHNTGIRAEFVRGAFGKLLESPIFGIGFDTPYRPDTFNYLYPHPLLTDADRVNVVSNHHSVFDTALRLGAPAAILFVFGIFFGGQKSISRDLGAVLMLSIAIGISFNAWFENQAQILELAFLIALLHAPRPMGTSGGGA